MQHLGDGAQREDHPVPLVPYPTGPACTSSPRDEKSPEAAPGQLRGSRACQSHAPSSSERCRRRVNRRRTPQATFSPVHTQSSASGERKTTPPCNLGHPGNLPPRSDPLPEGSSCFWPWAAPGWERSERCCARGREVMQRAAPPALTPQKDPASKNSISPPRDQITGSSPLGTAAPSAEGHSPLCSCCPSRALL